MTPILFAVTSAAVWGTADFCGGKATRGGPVLAVTLLSQLAGLPVIAAVLLLDGVPPDAGGMAWGAAAGLFGTLGLILLYRGLASGAMAVVAPVTAVTAAVVPFAAGLALDRRPAATAIAGVACAVVAIALISVTRSNGTSGGSTAVGPRLVGAALTAGAMFGLFFTLLERGGATAGLWPLAGARLASLALCGALVWRAGTALRMGGRTLGWTALAGVLDMAANAAYLVATHGGLLSVVAPIAALYPASTVLLSVAVDGERVYRMQLGGLCLAAAALVLVAA